MLEKVAKYGAEIPDTRSTLNFVPRASPLPGDEKRGDAENVVTIPSLLLGFTQGN